MLKKPKVNPKVQYFRDLWTKQGFEVTPEQKDRVGIAYIRYVLGVDDKSIQAFTGNFKDLKLDENPVQTIMDVKKIVGSELDMEKIRKIHTLYSNNMLGLSEEEIASYARKQFEQRASFRADFEVGYRQGGARPSKNDYQSFWKEVAETFPETYSEDDLKFLIKHGGSTSSILICLNNVSNSNVLKQLSINAHTFK